MVATGIPFFPLFGLSLLERVALEGVGALALLVVACAIALALLLRRYLKIIQKGKGSEYFWSVAEIRIYVAKD